MQTFQSNIFQTGDKEFPLTSTPGSTYTARGPQPWINQRHSASSHSYDDLSDQYDSAGMNSKSGTN